MTHHIKGLILIALVFSSIHVNSQTGVGTVSPVNKFEVVAASADPANTGSAANGNLRLGPNSGSHVLDFGLSSSSTYAWLQARSKSAYGTLYNLQLNPNGGNVGIGNTSASSTLTVGNAGGTIAGEITLNPCSNQNEGGQINIKKSLVGSTADWIIDQYGTSSSDARFRIYNSLNELNGMAIMENGNVGISYLTPTDRLVVGSAFSLHDGGDKVIGIGWSPGAGKNILAGYAAEIRLNPSAGRLSFGIDPTSRIVGATPDVQRRLFISSQGNVGIGVESPSSRLQISSADNNTVYIQSSTNDNNGMVVLNAATSQNWSSGWHEFMLFQNQGTSIGFIGAASGGNGVVYSTTSDYRLKTDIRDYRALDLIHNLKTYDYAWKSDGSRMYGFMAHELQSVLPYAVTGQKDAVDKDGKIIPQGVDYGKLTPVLVKAMQEQDEKIKQLQDKLLQMEKLLNEIMNKK